MFLIKKLISIGRHFVLIHAEYLALETYNKSNESFFA